jgi:hypothetical protein
MGRPTIDYSVAISRYYSGMSVSQCANLEGITPTGMYRTLKRRGVKFRSKILTGKANNLYRGGKLFSKKVHYIVEVAVHDGRLCPKPCEVCGCSAVAHHDDYNKPLDVRWLCPTHHVEWHKWNSPIALTDEKILKSYHKKKVGRPRVITHCKRGHELTPENTYYHKNGGRNCRTCAALHNIQRPKRPRSYYSDLELRKSTGSIRKVKRFSPRRPMPVLPS